MVCGSAVASVRHVVSVSPSSTFAATVVAPALSADTVQPVRGSGAGVATAAGTNRGMMCPACGSGAGAGSRCSTTAEPASTNMIVVADARAHHLPRCPMTAPIAPVCGHLTSTRGNGESGDRIADYVEWVLTAADGAGCPVLGDAPVSYQLARCPQWPTAGRAGTVGLVPVSLQGAMAPRPAAV